MADDLEKGPLMPGVRLRWGQANISIQPKWLRVDPSQKLQSSATLGGSILVLESGSG